MECQQQQQLPVLPVLGGRGQQAAHDSSTCCLVCVCTPLPPLVLSQTRLCRQRPKERFLPVQELWKGVNLYPTPTMKHLSGQSSAVTQTLQGSTLLT